MTLASPVEQGWRSLAGGLLEEICGTQLATGGSVSVDKKILPSPQEAARGVLWAAVSLWSACRFTVAASRRLDS